MVRAATVTPRSTLWAGIFNYFYPELRGTIINIKKMHLKVRGRCFLWYGTFGQIVRKIFPNFINTFMQGLYFLIPIILDIRQNFAP